MLPVSFPFLAPGEWSATGLADFGWQVGFLDPAHRMYLRFVNERQDNGATQVSKASSLRLVRLFVARLSVKIKAPCLGFVLTALARYP